MVFIGTSCRGRGSELALPDEAEGDAEQCERLDHGEADPDVREGQARRLRLARGGLDVGREDQTDTNAGADGRKTVADGGGATNNVGEKHFSSSWYLA